MPDKFTATQTATKTSLSTITYATLAVAAVAAAVAVGANIFSGGLASVVSVPGAAWECRELDSETANNVDPLTIPYYSTSFKTNNGDINNVKFFDIYNRSTTTCTNVTTKSRVEYGDKCLIDYLSKETRVINGVTKTVTVAKSIAVDSCSKADEDGVTKRNCRLQEGFVKNAGTLNPGVSNWIYYCSLGCNMGACVAPPRPDLEISRIFYAPVNIIRVEIKNNTGVDTGLFRLKYTIDGNTNYIEQLSMTTTSPATTTYRIVGLPENFAGGNHTITIVADDDNKVMETNENNNSLTQNITTCYDTDSTDYPPSQSYTGTPYFKGTCTDGIGSHEDACSGSSVVEYYFSGTNNGCSCAQQTFNCPAGCSNGACIATAACTDTDDPDNSKVLYGTNLEVKGTTIGYSSTGNIITKIDTCYPGYPNEIQEYFCTYANYTNPGRYAPAMSGGFYDCPAGKTCVDGACQ